MSLSSAKGYDFLALRALDFFFHWKQQNMFKYVVLQKVPAFFLSLEVVLAVLYQFLIVKLLWELLSPSSHTRLS